MDVATSVAHKGAPARAAAGGESGEVAVMGRRHRAIFLRSSRRMPTISYMSSFVSGPILPKLPRRTAWTSAAPRWSERRDLERVPLEIFLDEYVDDRPHRALTTNLSATGLYMNRVATRRSRWFRRQSRHVQLEFALPGSGESIWARGEIRYDELGMDLVHGTGVELVDMARAHQQMIRDYLYEQKKSGLQQILELVRKNRYH
jgi:hypothetical protein